MGGRSYPSPIQHGLWCQIIGRCVRQTLYQRIYVGDLIANTPLRLLLPPWVKTQIDLSQVRNVCRLKSVHSFFGLFSFTDTHTGSKCRLIASIVADNSAGHGWLAHKTERKRWRLTDESRGVVDALRGVNDRPASCAVWCALTVAAFVVVAAAFCPRMPVVKPVFNRLICTAPRRLELLALRI